MKSHRSRAAVVLSILCLGLAPLRFVSAQEAATYRVSPVYLPELERPAIDLSDTQLDDDISGTLPTFDGEMIMFAVKGGGLSDSQSKELVDRILGIIKFEAGQTSVDFVSQVEAGAVDEELIESESKRAGEEKRRELREELGELDSATEAAMNADLAEARRTLTGSPQIHVYNQMLGGVRFEHTGLRVSAIREQGVIRVQGRVFSAVELENSRSMGVNRAVEAAARYVSEYTKIVESSEGEPEAVILPYGKAFRHAWRVRVLAEDGPYDVWVDAGDGSVLQLEPVFHSDDGQGRVFTPDPNVGTRTIGFRIDGPSGGNYTLNEAGVLNVNTAGADGVCLADVTVPDAGTSFADFDVAPINGTVVDATGSVGYNCAFQEVNVYGWVQSNRDLFLALGSQAFASLTATVNHNNPCGFGINNACASGTTSLTFGIGARTTGTAAACNANLENSAIDATVVSHEFGHILNRMQYNAAGGTITGQINEGMADFWGMTFHNTDTFGSYWNDGGCAAVQTGWIPRQAEALDVFPEHRPLGGFNPALHSDGQMIAWALWQARTELNDATALGTLSINANLIGGQANSGVGVLTGNTDRRVHDGFFDLFQNVAAQYDNSRYSHKIMTGFARAGFFLRVRDAVIDIDDDYLDRNSATGPTFTVWTGRDYTFNAAGTALTGAPPFNTQFEVEVANDDAFSVNLVSSGPQGGVVAAAGGIATWTLPNADWTTLRAGDLLYYRVTTNDGAGGNARGSLDARAGVLTTVPPPRAVINGTGTCTCGGPTASGLPLTGVFWTLVPFLVAILWRRRVRETEPDRRQVG